MEAHEDLSLPYVDPFSARSKRKSEALKAEELSLKHHDAFVTFAEAVRKTQPFLRKATETELEGIFTRLTPAERRSYTEPKSTEKSEKKRVSDQVPAKPSIKAKSPVEEDFINDDDSDDVSLVSESDLDLGDEPVESHREHERKKKKKKEKKAKKESHASITSSAAGVKKFTWT